MSDLGAEYTPAESTLIRIFDRLTQRIGAIMTSAQDDAVNAVSDQLTKAKSEIDGVIADLQGQGVRPETLQRLQGLSQSFDDVVPDQPTPEPAPEPTPEPAPSPEEPQG